MRVAVNTLGINPGWGGGEEHFLRRTVAALEAMPAPIELLLFTDAVNHDSFSAHERCTIGDPGEISRAAHEAGVDVVCSGFDSLPRTLDLPSVAFVLQLYDLRQADTAKRLFGGSPLKTAREKAAHASVLVVPSEFMKREAQELLGTPLDRIVVAPFGVDDIFAEAQPGIVEEPYYLYVGRITERKNLPMLLDAFNRLLDELPHNLVIVGQPSEDEPESWGPRVVRIDRLGTRQLAGLYQHSDLVVCPSRYEGSGVLVLEALKAGARVAVGRVGGIPEVAGDAPIFFNAESADSLVAAMRRAVMENAGDRERRKRSAAQVSANRPWEHTARQVMIACRKAAG